MNNIELNNSVIQCIWNEYPCIYDEISYANIF